MSSVANWSYSPIQSISKDTLVKEYANQPIASLRTPALIIDRELFAQNCARMHQKAKDWGATFRAHLKTHKTTEGTRLQLSSTVDRTHAVVVSTLMEAWDVLKAGLIADETVKDILYGLPLAPTKIADLSLLSEEVEKEGGIMRILVDHPDQVKRLEEFQEERRTPKTWSAFVKIDGGQQRAGVVPESPIFRKLVMMALSSTAIKLYGFYGHAGNSYASKSISEASTFLSSEVDAVNRAAEVALSISAELNRPLDPLVLSIGSTPTAHAASAESRALLASTLHGKLELHAGNYPMLDLQQKSTGLVTDDQIAQRVSAAVVSYYPGRGEGGLDEALVDAGAIAFSKDSGPSGGYGEVIGHNWRLSRISQEHGILTQNSDDGDKLEVGSVVEIVGQHACLIAAGHPWYYIVDKNVGDGKVVVDVWVPWKGW